MRVNEYYYELISHINDIKIESIPKTNVVDLLNGFYPYIGDDDIKKLLLDTKDNIEIELKGEKIDYDKIYNYLILLKIKLFQKIYNY